MIAQVSVIVVSFNTREATLACLASIAASHDGVPLQIVLVDNGSTDGSADAVRAAHPDAVVVDAGGNLGFARGVELGVAHASGDAVLLLNPDTLVLPGSLQRLVDHAEAHPEYGVYGGRTLRPDGTLDPSSCWGAPTLWSLVCFATGLTTAFRGSRVFDPESLGRWQRDSVRTVPIVTGCLLLARRSDWDRIGGMDEAFFLYGEDAEFSMRARRLGYRPVIVPDAVIVHEVGGSSSSSGAKMCLVMAGKATLLRRVRRGPAAALGIVLLQAGAGLRALLERVTRAAEPSWSIVWRRRADWRTGYPEAEPRLLGGEAAEVRA
ncbi:glycosyltransferase family 2 protein [Agromyces larvae]|uniref:Glycosyltransferase family 2 protein n=1 Tax=Agromyces larvae TaxID=2929802 RepID=A0ABY4C002_9MICO|nr:glycosyltransferase family 2 protein [Agromyces larvae]UOE44339.1 glycosyltransferase family 2 protein [Agromyces larvae]